ncbi:hypothetical protein Gohar_021537 [Gossypium harknessii]|uniref:RNase H type-1 domain-containing protein n=1 Tax=Gossypium harknessii TaxID=34285 RepID=A0A7J9IA32_9ROSI|nr:hypothetical protein [Gossypium harknessii]
MSGFIIRNDEGFIMGSGFQGHNLVHSVVIAEALVVLHELQFALDLGFTNVILESDSRLVFIARERNGAAHAMAVEGMRTEGDLFWVEDAPLKALEVADSERQSS